MKFNGNINKIIFFLQVEAIVAHRFHNGKLAYKIRWKNYSANQDTWEPHGSLTCPDILDKYNKKVRRNPN